MNVQLYFYKPISTDSFYTINLIKVDEKKNYTNEFLNIYYIHQM